MKNTTTKGKIWEDLATKYLQKNDYEILEKNFKYSIIWEVDIIAKKDEKIIFFEVKYRENTNFWEPEESITPKKLEKIRQTIDFYSSHKNLDFEKIQFDVISIVKMQKNYRLKHFKNLEI